MRRNLMYLSEEKRTEIRECFEKHQYNTGLDPGENKISNIKGFHDTEGGGRKVFQKSYCALFIFIIFLGKICKLS